MCSLSSTKQKVRWKMQKGHEILGEGAFSRVYLGLNLDSGELLAVKRLRLQCDDKDEVESQLLKEIMLMRDLKHPNIVRYVDAQRRKRYMYILLEYVPGGSIAQMLSKFGAFSEPLVRVYTEQVLAGLAYLHGLNIIHRDIKGGNLLVSESGRVKLADFGCSFQSDLSGDASAAKRMLGSVPWMAPEVITESGAGRKADIWSLGCTVIEMLSGKRPWAHVRNQMALLYEIASGTTTPPLDVPVSDDVERFLACCLARNPKDRLNAVELARHSLITGTPQHHT